MAETTGPKRYYVHCVGPSNKALYEAYKRHRKKQVAAAPSQGGGDLLQRTPRAMKHGRRLRVSQFA